MKVKFYHKKSNKQPVIEFLNELPSEEAARIAACLSNIEKLGFDSPRVQFRQINGPLWEIKIKTHRVAGIGYFMYVFRATTLYCYMLIRSSHKKPRRKKLKQLKNV